MDRHLAKIARVDDDLVICEALGFAYQRDMTVTASYDEAYWQKCAGYEGAAIADAINRGRINLVARHAGECEVCDVGVGSGEFIKRRGNARGYDVNPTARAWLSSEGLLIEREELREFRAITFWDVLEHVPDPSEYLDLISPGAWMFTSIPIFENLDRIRSSKHYRPGEHLYYFTDDGFVSWLGSYGFELKERSSFEMLAGRDSIYSFAFQRVPA